MPRLAVLALLASFVAPDSPAAFPQVEVDAPDRWEARWVVSSWWLDTADLPRPVADGFARQSTPGAPDVPVARATLALPAGGTWSIRLERDSTSLLPGEDWARVPGWSERSLEPIVAPPTDPPAWTEVETPQGRLLRLAIPLAALEPGGMRLTRILRAQVTLSGRGAGPVPKTLASLCDNPVGAAAFGSGSRYPVHPPAGRGFLESAGIVPDGPRSLLVQVRDPKPGDLGGNGMVRLAGTEVRSLLGSLNGIEFARVAVAVPGRGALDLIDDSSIVEGGLETIPIRRVDLDEDGVFDPEDRIEFFAQGPSFWDADSSMGTDLPRMVVHPWDLSRRVLVRLDGDVGSPELPVGRAPASPVQASTTSRPVWAGVHRLLQVDEIGDSGSDRESGASWFWHLSTRTGLDSQALRHEAARDLPGLAGSTGIGVVRLASGAPSNRDTLRTYGGSASPLGGAADRYAWNLDGLRGADNRWRWVHAIKDAQFESYTVSYPYLPDRKLDLPFPAPRIGAFALPVTGSSASDSVIAVVRGVGVRILPLVGGMLRDSADDPDTWYVPSTRPATRAVGVWKAPTAPRSLTPAELASDVPGFDMLVVAPDSFLDLAAEYAAFRSDPKRIRPLDTRIARAEDIWLLWGRGSLDPLAIREVARKARDRWGVSHVLLLGGGHFDPRGVTGSPPVALPVWEDRQVATDAVLAILDPGEMRGRDRTQDVALGRIPARSRMELSAWLAKMRVLEDPASATSGPWRNTVLAVADDMQRDRGNLDGMGHTRSSETIVETMLAARPWLTVRKVYEVEYPTNASFEKPDAQRALIDQLNRGVAAWNYMGHGGWDVLSDERLLDTRSALLGLSNKRFPHLLFAGSCTVGRFDMVGSRGFAEALVLAAEKGAAGAVVGSRPSFPNDNEDLSGEFWRRVLSRKPDGAPRTLGEALQEAKNSFTPLQWTVGGRYSNSDVYNLLGDPGAVPFPSGSTPTLDSIPARIQALDDCELRGSAEAEVQASLVSPPTNRTATFSHGNQTLRQSYKSPGRTIVSVRTRSQDGAFLARLATPARIPLGTTANLHVYGWNPATLRDGAVLRTGIPLTGIGSKTTTDAQGPSIRILPCDSSWSAGQPFGHSAEIPLPFCLHILLDDSSGISADDSPDEGIILSVPGTLEPWHPTEIEEGADYSQVRTRLALDDKTFHPGRTYTLNVFARDLMGNASTRSVELHTRKAGEIDLYEVFNRPNPVKGDRTTFFFKLLADADSNGTVPGLVKASIRIHTLSGKLVRILDTDLTEVGHPRPRAVWDLQDAFRNEVANGLYPYTVRLRVKAESGGNWRQIERKGIVAVSR